MFTSRLASTGPSTTADQADRPADPRAPQPAAATAVLPHPDELTKADNRTAPRRVAASLPSISGVRLKPHGADATLVNLSATGVLVECGSRLKPGTAVTVVLEGGFSPSTIDGRVARSKVAAMQGGSLRYHIGIAFTNPIALDDEPVTSQPAAEQSLSVGAQAPIAVTAHEPVKVGPQVVTPVLENRW